MNITESEDIRNAKILNEQLMSGSISAEDMGGYNCGMYISGFGMQSCSTGMIYKHIMHEHLRYIIMNCPEKLTRELYEIRSDDLFSVAGLELIKSPETACELIKRIRESVFWNTELESSVIELAAGTGNTEVIEYLCTSRSKGSEYYPDYQTVMRLIKDGHENMLPPLTAGLDESSLEQYASFNYRSAMWFNSGLAMNSRREGLSEFECIYRYLSYLYSAVYPERDIRETVCAAINRIYLSRSFIVNFNISDFVENELSVFERLGVRISNTAVFLLAATADNSNELLEKLRGACGEELYLNVDDIGINSEKAYLLPAMFGSRIVLRYGPNHMYYLNKTELKKLIGSFERVEWHDGDTSGAGFPGMSRKEHYKQLISDDFTVFRLLLRKKAFDAAHLNELFLCAVESRNTRAIKELSPYIGGISGTA